MKRIIVLLLLICLAKLAGAQVPEPTCDQGLLTPTAGTPLTPTLATAGTDGTHPAALQALMARTRKLQAENQSLKGEVAALRARSEAGNSSIRQAVKETTAKVLFVVCLVAGLLLVALVSGQVFPVRATLPASTYTTDKVCHFIDTQFVINRRWPAGDSHTERNR